MNISKNLSVKINDMKILDELYRGSVVNMIVVDRQEPKRYLFAGKTK